MTPSTSWATPLPAQVVGDLRTALGIQLAEQVVDMRLCRRYADVQPTRDLLVTEADPDQFGSLLFAFGQGRP